MFRIRKALVTLALLAPFLVKADDLDIYIDNALASGWENWSWGTTLNFAATDLFEGTSSISVASTAWSALSVKLEGTFSNYAGLRFDIAGDNPDVTIYIQSTGDNDQSPSIPLSAFGQIITGNSFTSLLIDFNNLPGTGGQLAMILGIVSQSKEAPMEQLFYHLDNVILVESIVVTPEFLSAEPFANNVIAVTTVGAVNISDISVTLNQKVKLATVIPAISYPINPHIYGVNFPTDANYVRNLGIPMSRWGGNAVTAYNPFGGFTNAGNDWYFENRASDSADDWVGWVDGAGSDTMMTIPALDWVSKDATSYSYPASAYPDQGSFDPYNSNAGNGLFPNGSYINPVPNQNNVYVPWNTTAAKQWLSGLQNKPTIVTVDNEIEIASNTHQDMHPV
ncbi:hypothetical protein C0991_010935, partial [Blastosporella zonata]